MRRKNSPYILGLTGSIGVGKSEMARIFKRLAIPVSEADEIVKMLYKNSPVLQKSLSDIFPLESLPLSRSRVISLVMEDPFLLTKLEKIIHPLVKKEHEQHIQAAQRKSARLIVLDIPLLFETGWQEDCDGVLVMTCDPNLQKKRVLSRPGMTMEKFALFRRRQWDQERKLAHADFMIDTTKGRVHTFMQLRKLLENNCKEMQ